MQVPVHEVTATQISRRNPVADLDDPIQQPCGSSVIIAKRRMQAVVISTENQGVDQSVWPIGLVLGPCKSDASFVQFQEPDEDHVAEYPNGEPRKKLLQYEQTRIGFDDPLMRNRPRGLVTKPSRESDGNASGLLGDWIEVPFDHQSGSVRPTYLMGS